MVRTSVALTRSPASGLRLPACVCVCVWLMYFPGPTANNTSTQLLSGRRTRSDVRGSQPKPSDPVGTRCGECFSCGLRRGSHFKFHK